MACELCKQLAIYLITKIVGASTPEIPQVNVHTPHSTKSVEASCSGVVPNLNSEVGDQAQDIVLVVPPAHAASISIVGFCCLHHTSHLASMGVSSPSP